MIYNLYVLLELTCVASINRNQNLNSEIFTVIRGTGGAFPFDVGIYHVAALLALLGPVRSVRSFSSPAPVHLAELLFREKYAASWQIPGANLIVGALEFESGALGSIHLNGNTINEQQDMLIIFGTEGILQLGDPEKFSGYVKLIRPESGECLIPHTHGYNGMPILPDATQFESLYGHRGVGAAEMAWAIRKDRPNRCSKEFGFHSMEVLCGLDQAAAQGDTYEMKSTFIFRPLKSGYLSTMFHGAMRGDAELSLVE